jgi:hypothetical protein
MTVNLLREIDLIFVLLSDGFNPYTGEQMSANVMSALSNKYSQLLNIVQRAIELGYTHRFHSEI